MNKKKYKFLNKSEQTKSNSRKVFFFLNDIQ